MLIQLVMEYRPKREQIKSMILHNNLQAADILLSQPGSIFVLIKIHVNLKQHYAFSFGQDHCN